MNKVMLVGRLTKDLELRTTPSGMVVTRYTLAVSQNFVDKEGKRGTDFINCITWGRQAENLSKYCKKGSMISLEGRISNRSYDAQDGTKKYVTEVISENINFISTSKSDPDNVPKDINNMSNSQIIKEVVTNDDPFAEFSKEADLTGINPDDLPFN